MEKNRPWIPGQTAHCPDIPNLSIVNGDGTKSFVEVTSRMYPTEDHPRYGSPKPELWAEARRGEEMHWQPMVLATLGAMQLALEHPEREVHLIRYWYRPSTQTV